MPQEGDQVRIKIPEWLSNAKETDTEITGLLEAESGKAYGIRMEDNEDLVWIPKSQIESIETVGETQESGTTPKQEPEAQTKQEALIESEKIRNQPRRSIDVETVIRLKMERQLNYINVLMDEDPEQAYQEATQLFNQLQEYASKIREIIKELGDTLGKKQFTPAKKANE